MISFFARYRKGIFVGVVVIFLAGIFVGLGGYLFSGASQADAVAEVGEHKIPYQRFLLQVNRVQENMRESGTELTETLRDTIKQEVLREMIVEELLYQEAKKAGLMVSDFEVAAEVQSTPHFSGDGGFNMRAYAQTVWQQFHMMPEEYEAWRKKARMGLKFRQLVSSGIKLTPVDIKGLYLDRKGSMKDFNKDKEKFFQEISQERFMHTVNYDLRQAATRTEIKSFLREREKGL
ncbi:MAG: SurA N-terminal domain-containing protein [bacterium]